MLSIINEYNIAYTKIDDLVWTEIDSKEHYRNLKYVVFPKLQRKEMKLQKQYAKKVVCEILDVGGDAIGKIESLEDSPIKTIRL